MPFAYGGGFGCLGTGAACRFGGFDFSGIRLETAGPAWAIIALAAAEIFALPFFAKA